MGEKIFPFANVNGATCGPFVKQTCQKSPSKGNKDVILKKEGCEIFI